MDKYSKLKTYKETPDSEFCKCSGRHPIVLQSSLTLNPISCADCNLEVDLNKLNLDNELIEQIADWRDFHFCFYKLWLDSGEFEEWAKELLSNRDSEVNKRALVVVDSIRQKYECFYWWFIDNSSADYKPIINCPNCNQTLTKRDNKFRVDTSICRQCNIIVGQ